MSADATKPPVGIEEWGDLKYVTISPQQLGATAIVPSHEWRGNINVAGFTDEQIDILAYQMVEEAERRMRYAIVSALRSIRAHDVTHSGKGSGPADVLLVDRLRCEFEIRLETRGWKVDGKYSVTDVLDPNQYEWLRQRTGNESFKFVLPDREGKAVGS